MATSAIRSEALHKCAHCQQNAMKSCRACAGSPNDLSDKATNIWYCDTECQKGHRAAHKANCKTRQHRRIIYRAGETAQQLFYVYRKLVFEKLIVKMERMADEVLLYEEKYEDTYPFVQFPATLFTNEKEKQAVLAYLACDDALIYMHRALEAMLEGESRCQISTTRSA